MKLREFVQVSLAMHGRVPGLAQHPNDRLDGYPLSQEPLELGADLRGPIDGCFFL
jgi:hypothetical protein